MGLHFRKQYRRRSNEFQKKDKKYRIFIKDIKTQENITTRNKEKDIFDVHAQLCLIISDLLYVEFMNHFE